MKSVLLFLMSMSTAYACDMSGGAMSKVTIEEFADLQCPYCKQGADLMKQVKSEYGDKVKIQFRNMPLPFHPQALPAAKALASVCRLAPAKAYDYQAAIFAHPKELARDGEAFLLKTAAKLGVEGVKAEMESEGVAHDLAHDAELAKHNGFQGTPSFLVGKTPITGAVPYAELKKAIDAEL
jgi:protein-disulfide isomerase